MISFIVCTYNRDKYIYETLKRIAEQKGISCDCEIVVVDNNSTDRTSAECRRFAADYPNSNCHIIVEKNQGLSFARNRGIEESSGDLLVFLDDDAFVCEGYLDRLGAYIEEYPDMMAFGGKITPLFENGCAPVWLSKWSMSWLSALDRGETVTLFDKGLYPIGANMGIKRECLNIIGPFNTSLGRTAGNLMGGEEKDLFDRIHSARLPVYFFPEVSVRHNIPESRTSMDYVHKLGMGVGRSERVRTLAISKFRYAGRLFREAVKWAGTLVLWLFYFVKGQRKKGDALVVFRYNVTKGLV